MEAKFMCQDCKRMFDTRADMFSLKMNDEGMSYVFMLVISVTIISYRYLSHLREPVKKKKMWKIPH